MITQPTLEKSPYRTAGRTAIVSGLFGIIAFACLFTAVSTRTGMALSSSVYILFRAHDIGIIVQYLLMMPAIYALQRLSKQQPPGIGRAVVITAIIALSLVIIILLLVIPKIMLDDGYLIPQGVFGVCLMIVNWRMKGLVSSALRWFGIIVGLGLSLVGVYGIGYVILVTPRILYIPAVDPATLPDPSLSVANTVLHIIIWIGSLMGVLTLPIWTIFTGIKLLKYNHGTINNSRL